jgi:hypothetical protein
MEKNLDIPMNKAEGVRTFAWQAPGTDGTNKSDWKFIHHFVASDGGPGAASTIACSTGIGVLNGARNGTTLPSGDVHGVWAHLAAHLKDAGVKDDDVPQLKEADDTGTETRTDDDQGTPCPTCEGSGTILDGNRECPDCGGSGEAPEKKAAPSRTAAARARLYGDEFRSERRTTTETRCVREQDPDFRTAHRFEMREVANGSGGTSLRFTGYASVVEKPYEVSDMFGPYQETIARNAFAKTINDKADVNFLCNHDGITMARTKSGTLQLSSDSTGLFTEATLNLSRPDVSIVRAAVDDGDLDEMSFAFRATRQEWDEDYTQREIQEVNMHQGDVSVVNFGANPHTAGSTAIDLRDAFAIRGITPDEYMAALVELRAGAAISAANMKTLSAVLDLVQGADTNIDHALVELSALMGVKNPDIAQDADMDKTDPSKNKPPPPAEGKSAPLSALDTLPNYSTDAKARLARRAGKVAV